MTWWWGSNQSKSRCYRSTKYDQARQGTAYILRDIFTASEHTLKSCEIIMRAAAVLRTAACRITLFTRENCSLCDDAKTVLKQVWTKRPHEYDEIDVMSDRNKQWKALYEFDTPVVSTDRISNYDGSIDYVKVHIDRIIEGDKKFVTTPSAVKIMHRLQESQIYTLMDKVMTARQSD